MLFSCYLCCSMYCLCVNVYRHRVTTQLELINKRISSIIIILPNPKIYYRIYNSPPPVPILTQIIPIHALPSHSLKIYFNIIIPSTLRPSEWPLPLRSPYQNPVHTRPVFHICHMPRPSHYSLFDQIICGEDYRS